MHLPPAAEFHAGRSEIASSTRSRPHSRLQNCGIPHSLWSQIELAVRMLQTKPGAILSRSSRHTNVPCLLPRGVATPRHSYLSTGHAQPPSHPQSPSGSTTRKPRALRSSYASRHRPCLLLESCLHWCQTRFQKPMDGGAQMLDLCSL